MSRNARTRPVTLLAGLVLVACATARGAEDPEPPKLRFGIALTAKPTKNHFQDAVQKSPDFWLTDGTNKLKPSRVGFVYHIERAERDQILLSMPGQGLYGWAPRDSVVPYSEAEGYFTNELETTPPTSFAFLMRAIVCEDNDRFDRSFRDLGEALRLDPRNVAALIERSFLWVSRKRMDLALEDVNRALRIDPQSADALMERGVYHYRLKENQAALTDLDRAWELGSRSVYIPLVRGSIHVERRQIDDAIKAFHDAITVDPKSYDAHLMLGSAHLLRSRPNAAIQVFSRAIKLAPEKGGGYGGRAVAYMSLGQRRAALDDLNQAIRFDPMRADLFRDRGQVYAMEGQWKQALADLDTAIRIDPDDAEAHISRSWTLATCSEAKLRDGAKAVASATRACELTRWKSPRPLATLAAAFAEAGDFGGAVQMQQKAIAVTPEKDPVLDYYQACLQRYRDKKPWHRLGLLEEMGLRRYHPTAKPGTKDPQVEKASGPLAN
jgi:tetratricopeptide (TPR) repeat protein